MFYDNLAYAVGNFMLPLDLKTYIESSNKYQAHGVQYSSIAKRMIDM